jgi:hypothetical protein
MAAAGNAVFLMNTDCLTALGARPPFSFTSHKMSDAELPDVLQILHHTHAIPGSISFIQAIQRGARKIMAAEAVLNSGVYPLLAVPDAARSTGFRFEAVVTSASGAWLATSGICATKPAVHPAGSDERRAGHPHIRPISGNFPQTVRSSL